VFFHSAPEPIWDSATATPAQRPLVESVAPRVSNANPTPTGARKSWLGMKLPVLRVSRPLAIAALLLYVILVLYRIGKFWVAWLRTRAVVRSALPIKGSTKLNEARAHCELALNLKQLRVFSSTAVVVPTAARALRPLVILPAYLLADDD